MQHVKSFGNRRWKREEKESRMIMTKGKIINEEYKEETNNREQKRMIIY